MAKTKEKELTPMRKQYLEIKAQHPDTLLFFRLGDFYEMFDEDARIASRELDLTLTTRDRGKPKEEQTPMCGVPFHSYQSYLARLIAKGYKVAICEQTEDPATAKGLVSRDIIRIVTPGTVTDDTMLTPGQSNYICAIAMDTSGVGVCFCDISTGEAEATSFPAEGGTEHLLNELGRFSPTEALLSPEAAENKALAEFLTQRLECCWQDGGAARFEQNEAIELTKKQFPDAEELTGVAYRAVGGVLNYLYETQKADLSYLSTLRHYESDRFMELDLTARRNLELTETLRGGEKKGSLLWVLDKTRTAMGSRLMRTWLEQPLLSPAAIRRRLDAVQALVEHTVEREELILALREVTDLERLIGRVVYGSANARDLSALAVGLGKIPQLRERTAGLDTPMLKDIRNRLDDLPELRAELERGIADEPPLTVREGGMIRPGYSQELDELHSAQNGGKDLVAKMEARVKEQCGIRNMKVSYNKVFGYYIEVSKGQANLVPEDWVRKQTTVNSERFINQELKELERTIFTAGDKAVALEYELFTGLREKVAQQVNAIQASARAIAELDVLCSYAAVAVKNHYCMPQVDDSGVIDIKEGRHPVVEQVLKDAWFVPNDTYMDEKDDTLAIITGPNMAGKSTYMRQVALISLMAQAGSFVPAQSAHLGVVDRVFTRIGASDDLSAGASTFMVEMNEVAEILKHATHRSLLILDEIGRGTSTYDGMSIARAVLEYCAGKKLGAKTLFATHYHELTVLEGMIPGVKNYNIAAKKKKDDIIFLRKIVRGGADQSYGIEVAKLAGVPDTVIRRARAILEELEQGEGVPVVRAQKEPEEPEKQVSLLDLGAVECAQRIRELDLNTLTPIEAMNLLYELKGKL
jgi:DNA mismatch repair protein MutS